MGKSLDGKEPRWERALLGREKPKGKSPLDERCLVKSTLVKSTLVESTLVKSPLGTGP